MTLLFIPIAVKIWMTLLIIAALVPYLWGISFKHIKDNDKRLDYHETKIHSI